MAFTHLVTDLNFDKCCESSIKQMFKFCLVDKRRIVQVADSKTVKLGEAENETELEKVQNDIEIIQPSNDKPPGMTIIYFLNPQI